MKIKLYGYLKEKHGKSELILNYDRKITIKELAMRLSSEYDISVDLVRFAVNNEFVNGDFIVDNNSVVDLIPPVAGG